MKNNKDKNTYLIFCVCSVFILMVICYFGTNYIVKDTWAGFGGLSGCMNASIDLIYDPNYPDGFEISNVVSKKVCSNALIIDNMYDIPLGYEFIGWNTNIDGTGKMYYVGNIIILPGNFTLYAQWNKKAIDYVDLNKDSNINKDDYLLLNEYLNGNSVLNSELLLVADVNGDSNVDEIDLDIIKNVYLGTEGYIGYLPKEIVPIYELYVEENDDIVKPDDEDDMEDNNNDNVIMGPGSNGHVSGNGTGTSGSGSSSTGTGGNNIKPNNNTNKPNSNSSNSESNNNLDIRNEEVFEPKTYNFKFIVDNVEYDNTKCDTGNSKSCKLVLPNDNPMKKGYKFNGWSTIKDCPSNVGINYTVLMEDNATYYACFLEIERNSPYNIFIVILLIIMIWILSVLGIIYLIKRFKKAEIVD